MLADTKNNVVVMKGRVVEMQLITPHSILVSTLPMDSGKMIRWQAEMNDRALNDQGFRLVQYDY